VGTHENGITTGGFFLTRLTWPRGYIRAVVGAIEVDDKAIRIITGKDILQAVIAGKQAANGNVRGFVRKWRADRHSIGSTI
jgi:hypothetical protein